jgi:hypothetical protein
MMSKVKSWEVTDEFWHRAEASLPVRQRKAGKLYSRKPGAGRKPKDARLVFEAIDSMCCEPGVSGVVRRALWQC